ncbi:hypothetical protein BBO99_00001062 [Phytophthora kernoviae]|uniref:Phosphodiesterase n=2 Tax=Phytophthora kernoviae TaxID=325452 RepID=A0A3R7KYB6_9STRA|nr:hypothetical protein G195_004042 [Phytophthora kernoviae 00238/432]KAG2532459.1 hypothetical protein JM16_000395 [Phytophthora kernoviae]KAG2533425.1 hypothetical protein JM18_000312 [Phytophthora kernoviae]RLN06742.1 hypothetical protein BBI17_001033 [Phytophthora kernoviae]RLN84760.1 hypothetical protein BBO99_00001062 [Phytophthora kernoviae]
MNTTGSTTRSGNKAMSLVSGMLSWLMSCTGGTGSDPAEQLEDGYDLRYLVEQRHRAFWELVQRILELNDVVLMIRMLLDFLQDDLGASVAAVFLVDQNSQSMSRIMRGTPTESGLVPSRGLVGEALRSRVARFLVNFNLDEGYDAEVDLAQEFQGQKLFCVPLIEHDAVYAIIQATTAKPTRRVMDELHVKLLTWLGPILSSCMRKCIEFHDVLLSERTQKALLHIISSSDTEDTVLNLVDGVIDGACHITKAGRVSLFMVDWETEELWSLSSSDYDETLRVPLRASMLGLAATTQHTLNVRNPHTDHRYNWMTDQRRGIDTECVLYVPVGVQESSQISEVASTGSSRPVAVLEIINKMEAEVPGGMTGSSCCGGFTFDDECAFEAFACEVAVILRRRGNEIEYIKLLADTRAEQVLAKRARSQVNLLECYTSYASTVRAAHPEACLRNSFVSSDKHVADCPECAAVAKNEALVERIAPVEQEVTLVCGVDHARALVDVERLSRTVGGAKHQSGRLGYEFVSSEAEILSRLVFSAPPGSRFASWDFNVFTADLVTLPKLLEEMYLDFKVDEVLHTTKHRLQNFIVAMKEHYHPNPFHNFLHAFSVVHASYLLLSTTDAAQMLQPLDIAACLVASLGHDVDHPGHTNDFEVVSGSQLAMLYSDESVLEHHHAYTTFRLISKEKNANILQNLTRADYRHVRKMVITAILGTDMANHFKFLESLEKVLRPASHHVDTSTISTAKRDSSSVTAIVATEGPVVDTPRGSTSGSAPNSFHSTTGPKFLPGRSSSGRLTKNGWVYNGTVEDRLFLVKTLVHASDLSGQVFPKAVALKWSNMISKEFAYQALMEQAENIPISYRNIDDPLKMVEGQLFFAQKIVSPLWDLMHIMLPGLEHCMENLTANVAHYEQELQRLKDARFEEGLSADAMRQEREQRLEREEEDLIEQQQNRRARRDSMCGCDDEGVAVPGLARHNPAKFNSFRTIPEDDSNSDDVEAGDGDSPSVRSSVLAAAEQSRQLSRSRSNSSSSSSSEEIDEQALVVYE